MCNLILKYLLNLDIIVVEKRRNSSEEINDVMFGSENNLKKLNNEFVEIIGIIAEYNPFHNGHIYHIEKIKEKYPNSIIILVINGYFLERGEISILSKENKTNIALNNKVNIVIELPLVYGTQSADTFADESIKLLNKMNVTKLIFGSESNDINLLKKLAQKQLEPEFDILVKKYLNEGINYPTALAKATNVDFDYKPNDLLGISYIKSIIKNKYNIEAECIKRTSAYHDLESNDEIISASNIRNKLKSNEDINKYLPSYVIDDLIRINKDMYFKLLKYKIITDENLNTYLDVDEGIEYRLKKNIINANTLDEFIEKIKTKRYTYNKLNRMFIHILIGLKKQDNKDKQDYLRILGFDALGKKHLQKFNIKSYFKQTKIYDYELKASLLYDLINDTNTYEFETKNKPIIKD